MRINFKTYLSFLWLILAGWPAASLWAQTPFDPEFAEEASLIREQLQVFTDRNLYAVDEYLHFAADHRVSGPLGDLPWSSVLYVELLASNGEALVRGKYKLAGGRAKGSLHIPAESMTGNYILKCYTRWMRNAGSGTFSYIPLRIINPFRSEVISQAVAPGGTRSAQRIPYRVGMLECSTAKDNYQAGQEVMLQVRGTPDTRMDPLRCCVTVVPEGAIDPGKGQLAPSSPGTNHAFRVNFLPDLGDNISISGTVIGPDQEPVPYTTLHFSMLGRDPDYFAALSDIHGRFVISTPTGEGEYKEFFVTPEQDNGSGLEVRIDQEYDSRPLDFPMEKFLLTDTEREVARKMTLNMQLSKVYKPAASGSAEPPGEPYAEGDRIPFYGTHVNRLLIDDYVMLPNLEEVFINLIPEVQFYKKQGRNRIRIHGNNNSIRVYNPLIMIDHISVFDHEALLALAPEKIERIDLIPDIYLKGSVPFGGVLAIHSRKGDMAGIDLPPGSYFFDYQAFHSEAPPVDPLPLLEDRVPDTRNTLLWSADLLLQEGEELEISLRAPTTRGRYVVLVRAVSPEGEVIKASSGFTVE
jgi:hypothetical protein